MPAAVSLSERPAAIRVDLGAIFVSMELSRSKWLITSLSPGGGEKMSKHMVAGGDLETWRHGRSARTAERAFDPFLLQGAVDPEALDSLWRLAQRALLNSPNPDQYLLIRNPEFVP